MKFWQNVSFVQPADLLDLARISEAAGFDGVMVSDHIVHPQVISSPYPYDPEGQVRWPSSSPWPDPWVLIGAMAAVTTRLRFMTTIYIAAARNPFVVAKAVGTAAVLSANRVHLGVGAGWMREEFELLGQEFPNRGERLDELLEILPLLWQGEMVGYHGKHYDFDPVQMRPAPSEPVPMLGGGHSQPAIRRAAGLDGWIGNAYTPEDALHFINILNEHRRRTGTIDNPGYEIVIAIQGPPDDIDLYRRMADAGVTSVMCEPFALVGSAPAPPTIGSADGERGLHGFGDVVDRNNSLDAKRRVLEDFSERVIARVNR